MEFLLGYNIATVTLWGKLTFAGGVYWGNFSKWWVGNVQIFG